MRNLVPFEWFKKREKHPWRSVTFSKVAACEACNLTKSNTPPWSFSRFLYSANSTKSNKVSQKIIWHEVSKQSHYWKDENILSYKTILIKKINTNAGLNISWEPHTYQPPAGIYGKITVSNTHTKNKNFIKIIFQKNAELL